MREDCLKRNASRPEDERVLAKGIRGTAREFQPPQYDEGFDVLYGVGIDAAGSFVAEEWRGTSGCGPLAPHEKSL